MKVGGFDGNQKHFGIYGVCLQDGNCSALKTRGPYQHRFDLPGGSQEVGEGLTETPQEKYGREVGAAKVKH